MISEAVHRYPGICLIVEETGDEGCATSSFRPNEVGRIGQHVREEERTRWVELPLFLDQVSMEPWAATKKENF